MNAAPLTTIPRPKHTFARSAFRVSASTKRQTHQPTRKVTTNPAIGIAIVSTYARTLAGTLHPQTCLIVMRHEAFFTVSISRVPARRYSRVQRRYRFWARFRRAELRQDRPQRIEPRGRRRNGSRRGRASIASRSRVGERAGLVRRSSLPARYSWRRDGVGSTSVGLGQDISLSVTQHFCWVFRVHMTTAIMPISKRRTVSVGFCSQAA
jgi:hypothetical protein